MPGTRHSRSVGVQISHVTDNCHRLTVCGPRKETQPPRLGVSVSPLKAVRWQMRGSPFGIGINPPTRRA